MADGAAVRSISAKRKSAGAPYIGARPFVQADQDRFFGRRSEAKALLELWQDNRLTIVVGSVASGKTSLLNAGVFPLLTQNCTYVLPPGRLSSGATFPSAALPAHNPYVLGLLHSWSPGETPTRLVDLSVGDFIRSQLYQQHSGPLFAAIDQVDDLLADSNPRRALRQKFLGELADALRTEPRLHLLLMAREEGADVISHALGTVARYNLTALTRQGAIEAVAGPAAAAGRSFADDAAEKLVSDLQVSRIAGVNGAERHVNSDYVEPALLQAVCAHLWASLPPETERITPRDVRLFGGADKALALYCGQVIASVADDHDLQVTRLRTWLLSTFVTELGTRGAAYEGAVATAGMPNAVVRALRDRHLLSVAVRSGSRWYELLSDRLIQPLRDAADELPPATDPAERLAAAERALTLGELDAADRYAQATLRSSSDTDLRLRAEVESLLGNIATEREKPTEAESHYRVSARLSETLRDSAAVASQLAAVGQTLIAQGHPEDAVDELQAAIERMPNDPVMQTDLALALWRLGESQAAVAVLTAILGLDGGNPVALRARGEILADLGEARQAMLDLNRVTLRERPSTRAARGLALAKLGDQPGADLDVDDAVAEAPRNGAVLLFAARAKALNGDESAAEELARRAVDATDPVLPPYHREIALQLAGHKHRISRAELAPRVFHRLLPEGGDAVY